MISPDRESDPRAPLVRIGELGRRVGVRPETLRAWERRYNLLTPKRSASGYRLYSAGDEARVREMLRWIGRGVSTAEAARLALEVTADAATGAGGTAEATWEHSEDADVRAASRRGTRPVLKRATAQLVDRLQAFDETGAHDVLDRAFGRFSLDTVLAEVVLPALADIGRRWSVGDITVGQEHFCTELIRGQLIGIARGWGSGGGPLALLACPPGERHDLGLVSFGLALRERSWRIAFLGQDTPLETLAETADDLEPDAVVVASVDRRRFEDALAGLHDLASRRPLYVAGAGADTEVARRVGAELLAEPPVSSAGWLADRWR